MIRDTFANDRGQVGIGTLIVFIALVLVAAIAAGVLINTAGFLQTQAEETGQDSTDQVADNINVIGEVGEVTDENWGTLGLDEDDEAVYETRLTVQRSPGSDDIDLTGLSIQWVGDNGFAQLVHVSQKADEIEEENEAGEVYFVQDITAESDEDAVLTDDGDRYEIVVPTGIELQDIDGDGDVTDIEAAFEGQTEAIFDGEEEQIYDNEDTDVEVDLADLHEGTVYNIDNTEFDILTEGDEASLEITTNAGATRNVAISVPDTLIGEEGGTVTL